MGAFSKDKYELVIVGAGPTGLAAALYAAREGMSTLVLEKAVIGGMAAITDLVDNYPGFDQGVGGLELAEHLHNHATRFGAEVKTGVDVTCLHEADGNVTVLTSAGNVTAEAVLVATGSSYKHLDAPGEAEYIGRGVHFCATCDAPLYRGRDVTVVGGGNSAIQESLFIARFAKHVTLLVRGPALKGTEVIREQLTALRNVSFRYNTVVKEIRGNDSKVTGLRVKDTVKGDQLDLRTDGIFVFIGLLANTDAFKGTLELDERNFIITKDDYSTRVPGVYAAGDVRSGSTWQIASAAGEGVTAALEIRKYLDTKHHIEHKTKTVARQRATEPKAAAKAKPKPAAPAKKITKIKVTKS
jgi:thioredoxin reductase (NADPH)